MGWDGTGRLCDLKIFKKFRDLWRNCAVNLSKNPAEQTGYLLGSRWPQIATTAKLMNRTLGYESGQMIQLEIVDSNYR